MNIRAATTARRLLQLAVILLLTACALPGLQAQPNCLSAAGSTQDVDIVINSSNVPEFAPNMIFGCGGNAQGKGNGYICNPINTKTDFRFKLPNASQGWSFIGIQLSGDGQHWPGDLPLGAYSDFEFDSDESLLTGKPYAHINGINMTVKNNNCHEFTVSYRLLLKKPGTAPNTWEYYYLHPIMDNRGSNNN